MSSEVLPFAMVDVFARRPLTGNPLAVVWEADDLPLETMRAIAREFNQSETTFILAPTQPDALRQLRSFTPTGVEVYGAGHQALGAWWLLAATGQIEFQDGTSAFRQEIGDMVLPLYIDAEHGRPTAIRMNQEPATFLAKLEKQEALASSLGMGIEDLDESLPTQVISTGAGHLMVPARDRHAVDRAEPDAPALRRVLAEVGGEGCYLFSLDTIDPASTV